MSASKSAGRVAVRDRVIARIDFAEARTYRGALQFAAEGIGQYPEATGAVLIEDPDYLDRVSAVEFVFRPARRHGEEVAPELASAAAAYTEAVIAPRAALREQAAAEREQQRADRAARRASNKATAAPEPATEPDTQPEPLPTDAEIEQAARADAARDVILRPVSRTPRTQRVKMTAAQRSADTRARVAAEKARMAVVLAERKAQRLAEREAIRSSRGESAARTPRKSASSD